MYGFIKADEYASVRDWVNDKKNTRFIYDTEHFVLNILKTYTLYFEVELFGSGR